MVSIGHDLDLLYITVRQLKEENRQLLEQNQRLEKELVQNRRQQYPRLRKLEIHIENAEDDFTKLAIFRLVNNKLKPLLEHEQEFIAKNPELAKELVDQQRIRIHQDEYVLHVQYISVGEFLRIWVKASKIAPGP